MNSFPASPPPDSFARGFGLTARAGTLLLTRSGLKRYALLPLLANGVLYVAIVGAGIWGLWHLEPSIAWEFWGPVGGWLAAAVNGVSGSLKWVLGLPLLLLVCYFSFTTVGMIVASPLNDLLSEKIEEALTGTRPENLSWGVWTKTTLLSLWDSSLLALKQILVTLLLLPMLLIPVIGWGIFFALGGWNSGRSFLDVPLARHGLRHRDKKPHVQANRKTILGLGVAMQLLFLIPFAGLLMLPLGVAAGTMLWCEEKSRAGSDEKPAG